MITYPELSKCGRLGNQLWQIASTAGLAFDRSTFPQFPRWDYQPFFSVPEELFVDAPEGQQAIDLVPHMGPQARAYLQDHNLFTGQSRQSLNDYAELIREWFEPSPAALTMLEDIWEEHFAELPEPLISVHVRRGDNVTHPQGYHPLRSLDYYKRALELRPEGTVVCFSDDPQWCRENLEEWTGREVAVFYEGTARPREYVDRQLYENAEILDWIDLQLMSAMDHHIISNSTYAWWGAFLSDDPQPIYPCVESWFGWRLQNEIDASLMFPSHWLPVHDDTEGGSVAHVHTDPEGGI